MEESSMKAARAHVKSHVEATKQGQFSRMMHHEHIAHKISMPSMQNKTGSTLVRLAGSIKGKTSRGIDNIHETLLNFSRTVSIVLLIRM